MTKTTSCVIPSKARNPVVSRRDPSPIAQDDFWQNYFFSLSRGLSLIELVVAIGIFILTVTVLLTSIIYFYRSQRIVFAATASVDEARRGLNTAVKEIRKAVDSEAGNYTLETADGDDLTFYSDIDADGRVERVRYFFQDSEFRKGVVEPVGLPVTYPLGSETVQTVARYVVATSTPVFTYYNGDWPADTVNNPLPAPAILAQTKLILIRFLVDLNPGLSPELFEVQAYAQIRNLKDNL